MAQYTITGYDASAHMSEETRQASRSAAIGMVMSVVVSVVFGFILLTAITFAIPNTQGVIDAGVFPVPYIWETSLGASWALFLLIIAAVAQFFCGTASVTSASRMMFAFSRDRAVPGHFLWRTVANNRVRTWPSSRSVCWPGCSCCRRCSTRPSATWWAPPRGHRPLHLDGHPDLPAPQEGRPVRAGRLEPGQSLQVDLADRRRLDPVRLRALPAAGHPDGVPGAATFDWAVVNYAPITVGAVLLLVGAWYLLSARKWFTGPVREAGTETELAEIERDSRAVSSARSRRERMWLSGPGAGSAPGPRLLARSLPANELFCGLRRRRVHRGTDFQPGLPRPAAAPAD